jgi:hypothetical protein
MNRNLKIVLLVFIILVCLVPAGFSGIAVAWKLYRWYSPYLDQEIAGPTTITSEWLEIEPKSPLRVERQTYSIALDLDKSIHEEPNCWGLMLPDGSIVRAQVQLVGDDGITYELKDPSFSLLDTGETLANFSLDDLPRDRIYIKVRIRAEGPVRCRRIFWRNYNQWDAERLI